ncbi:MAG: amidohydrolase [Actinobacteria bacterium]|nr:amidohydrolase [Actinomycetota bacterium]
MDAACSVHAPGYVDVEDGLVAGVGPLGGAPPPRPGAAVLQMGGLLLPGLLNGHAHTSMTVLRGTGEGLPLDRWLREAIWPREARLSPADVAAGMALGSAEMLLNGVTTTNEMYFFPEQIAAGAARAGIRAIVGAAVISGPERFGSPAGQITEAVALSERHAGDPMVEFTLGPHSAYTVGDEALAAVRDAALAHGMAVHIHVAETRSEGAPVEERTGMTVPAHLEALGLLEARVIAAHGVWLTPDDMALFGRHGVGVAHCPGSNGKLASGIAPVRAMREAGVNVSVSTDGPASNDDLDVLSEARLALLYARLRDGDAQALGVEDALRMVTSEAAAALGRDDLGALEPGRRADVVRFSLDRPEYGPLEDPAEVLGHLVWAGSARDVTDVWVGGRRVVENGALTTIDLDAAAAEVRQIAARIAG